MPKRSACFVLDAALNNKTKRRCDRYELYGYFSKKRYDAAIDALFEASNKWFDLKLDYFGLLRDFEAFDRACGYANTCKMVAGETKQQMEIYDNRDITITENHDVILLDDVFECIHSTIGHINEQLENIRKDINTVVRTGLQMLIFEPEFDVPLKDYEIPDFGWFFFFPYFDLTTRENSDIELD